MLAHLHRLEESILSHKPQSESNQQFLCAFLLVAVPILIDVTALRHAGLLIEGER